MKKCAHHNCSEEIPPNRIACLEHFSELPKKITMEIFKGNTTKDSVRLEAAIESAKDHWKNSEI